MKFGFKKNVRSTTQILVLRYQYGIFTFIPQTSLFGETSSGTMKHPLLSQANVWEAVSQF